MADFKNLPEWERTTSEILLDIAEREPKPATDETGMPTVGKASLDKGYMDKVKYEWMLDEAAKMYAAIVPMGPQDGIPWEQWRPSKNIETKEYTQADRNWEHFYDTFSSFTRLPAGWDDLKEGFATQLARDAGIEDLKAHQRGERPYEANPVGKYIKPPILPEKKSDLLGDFIGTLPPLEPEPVPLPKKNPRR